MNRTRVRIISAVAFAFLLVPCFQTIALAYEANVLLNYRYPTAITVREDRFGKGAIWVTEISDVKFCDRDQPTTESILTEIPPLFEMNRNGVTWYEDNMLVSGKGFSYRDESVYPFGKFPSIGLEAQPRYLHVRVMYPSDDEWNGRLFFYSHGSSWVPAEMLGPFVEPELLLQRGWAVAMAQFSGVVPMQQNLYDDSYWQDIGKMYEEYLEDGISMPNKLEYLSNPYGRALGDSATSRNIINLIKNLLDYRLGQVPHHTYWGGWSAGGTSGRALNTGRDPDGNYTGGNFNIPYIKDSGLVIDGFIGVGLTGSGVPDEEFPVTAPVIFIDGRFDYLAWAPFGNALSFAKDVKEKLDDESIVDPEISKDINDWMRHYMRAYGNHDFTSRFYEVAYSGGDWYYDISVPVDGWEWDPPYPLDDRINKNENGRRLNWIWSKMKDHAGGYMREMFSEHRIDPGWGQGYSAYYHLADGYNHQLLTNLVKWVEEDRKPPTSRIDSYLLSKDFDPEAGYPPDMPIANALYPYQPFPGDQDYLYGWGPNSISQPYVDLLQWQKDNKEIKYKKEMIYMPHFVARTGVFLNGTKVIMIRPFTADELYGGYSYGNVEFKGYHNYKDYIKTFAHVLRKLVRKDFYDPEIADFYLNGDPAAPSLPPKP
jgi:hypothetical protein